MQANRFAPVRRDLEALRAPRIEDGRGDELDEHGTPPGSRARRPFDGRAGAVGGSNRAAPGLRPSLRPPTVRDWPRALIARPTAALGGLLVVLAAAVLVGVVVHVCVEAEFPADRHLPILLVLLLAAVVLLGLGVALILPRPPRGS